MIYLLVGLLQRVTFRVFFKHIHIANLGYIPHNKPVVIACNHPGAFMDPGFIGSIMRKPIYYTSRGDVFSKPFAAWFLNKLHIQPIYRLEEGFCNLSKNFKTIEALSEILKKNGVVVVFSEGQSALDRRLRVLRKGTARIFLQIEKEHNLDIQLYATGITYTHKKNFRKSVMYSISKPLHLRDYLTDFISHPQRGYHTFILELAGRLRENFVIVSYPECDTMVDYQINYYCSTEKLSNIPVVVYNRKKLDDLQALSKRINQLFESNLTRFEELQNDTNNYEQLLEENGISDYGLVNKPLNIAQFLLLVLMLPFTLAGFYFWGISYLVSKRVADKKVTRVDFYDSVNMNTMSIIFMLITLVSNIVLAFFIGWWSLLIWPIAPVFGEFLFWTYDAMEQHTSALKAKSCPNRIALLKLREKIVNL